MVEDFWQKNASICKKHNAELLLNDADFYFTNDDDFLPGLSHYVKLEIDYGCDYGDPVMEISPAYNYITGKQYNNISFYNFVDVGIKYFYMDTGTPRYKTMQHINKLYELLEELEKYWQTIKLKDVPQLRNGEVYHG